MIVPDPYNPQAYDRYAYALNNPLRYTDPSGHRPCDDQVECSRMRFKSTIDFKGNCDQACRRSAIHTEYKFLQQSASDGAMTDLEAFARLADYAAGLAGDCVVCFMDDLGATVTGHSGQDSLSPSNRELNIRALHGIDAKYDPYFVDIDRTQIQQSGFAPRYQDSATAVAAGGGGQPRHFWFYVQVSFEEGHTTAVIGDWIHENLLGDRNGMSNEDYALGIQGADLGTMLSDGTISPSMVGNWIRDNLSPSPQNCPYCNH